MEAKAIAKYVRMSPIKVGAVTDLIRGKDVKEAFAILQYTPREAAVVINKVLKSAVANAENNFALDTDKLYVSVMENASIDELKKAGLDGHYVDHGKALFYTDATADSLIKPS